MGFSLSLKTKEQLAEEQRRRYAAQVRRVEGGVRTLEALYCQAAQRGEDKYQQGKALLAVGRNREARMLFQFARIQECHAANRMRQESLWSNALTQLKVAQSVADDGAYGVGGAAVDDIMKQAEDEIAAENGLPISGVGDAASGRCL